MKILSEATESGLRAIIWMAQRPGAVGKVREIARDTKSAPGYLVKVLHVLAKAGILAAQRGTNGGFTLLRDPAKLTVLDIVDAIDPFVRTHTCPPGRESHCEQLHALQRRIDDAITAVEATFACTCVNDLLSERACSPPRPLDPATGVNRS